MLLEYLMVCYTRLLLARLRSWREANTHVNNNAYALKPFLGTALLCPVTCNGGSQPVSTHVSSFKSWLTLDTYIPAYMYL